MDTLSDHNGRWCAKCLRYFDNDREIELHHIYPKWETEKDPRRKTILGWTVSVHKKGCHRMGVQRRSDAAGVVLQDVLASHDERIKAVANSAFFDGNLNLSGVLWEELAPRAVLQQDVPTLAGCIVNAAVNAGGSIKGSELLDFLLELDPEGIMEAAGRSHSAKYHLAVGSIHRAVIGDAAIAKIHYDEAYADIQRLKVAGRRNLMPQYKRRQAAVEPSVSFATEALRAAFEIKDIYGVRTALLIAGWNYLVASDASRARGCFERVFSESQDQPISWWHQMEANFGLGLAVYLGKENLEDVLYNCLRAQYISVILGLCCGLIVGVRRVFDGVDGILTPSLAVGHIGSRNSSRLTRAYMSEHRQQFINEHFQLGLFRELSKLNCQL